MNVKIIKIAGKILYVKILKEVSHVNVYRDLSMRTMNVSVCLVFIRVNPRTRLGLNNYNG